MNRNDESCRVIQMYSQTDPSYDYNNKEYTLIPTEKKIHIKKAVCLNSNVTKILWV